MNDVSFLSSLSNLANDLGTSMPERRPEVSSPDVKNCKTCMGLTYFSQSMHSRGKAPVCPSPAPSPAQGLGVKVLFSVGSKSSAVVFESNAMVSAEVFWEAVAVQCCRGATCAATRLSAKWRLQGESRILSPSAFSTQPASLHTNKGKLWQHALKDPACCI